MKTPTSCFGAPAANSTAIEGEKKNINKELWQCCAGPLVNLPAAGTHVVYFPQGHSEQVAASMKKDMDSQIPSYPNLPPKLLCLLHSVTLLADSETDEVYARMTLQPVPSFDKEALLRSDLSMKTNKPQTEFFCKTLTASDTSTHGGFSVPRRAAEKIFPPLDFTMQPPAQEIVARDLHNNVWTFRHIFRGQPKRHLLTTGWSLFVGGKRLIAGDSVLFIRDEKQQLLLGIRRANRQPPNLSSSVLSSDSMHIGVLAAAAHAAANNSPFTVFYNPRTSPSEFVIPLAKYYRAVCSNQISLGMRFRMVFETEESGTRRYMGTITGISDLDPVRWKNSQWRNLQVGWDESAAGEKRSRVSIWEIEPVTAPFFICPTPSFFRPKRPWQPSMPDEDSSDVDGLFKRTMPWFGDEFGLKDSQALPGLSLAQWMNMQQNSSLAKSIQPNFDNPLPGSILQNLAGTDLSCQVGLSATQVSQQNNPQFGLQRPIQSAQQLDQLQKLPNNLGSIVQPQQQMAATQVLPTSQVHSPIQSQSQSPVQTQNVLQQQHADKIHQLQRTTSQSSSQQQQRITGHTQHQNPMPSQLGDQVGQQLHMPDNQIQLQLLQKLHQQQQSLRAQSSGMQQSSQLMQVQDQQKLPLDTPPNISKPVVNDHELEGFQQAPNVHHLSHTMGQKTTENRGQTNLQSGHSPSQSKHPQQQPQSQSGMLSELPGHSGSALTSTVNHQSTGNGNVFSAGAAGGRQSTVTDDLPSCSTSPSTNNCTNAVQSMLASGTHTATTVVDGIAQSSAAMFNSTGFDPMSSHSNLLKEIPHKSDVPPSMNISKIQNQGFFASPTHLNAVGGQVDYLDGSFSVTSVLCHNEGTILQNSHSFSFNCRSELSRDPSHAGEARGDLRNNVPFGDNIDNQLGMQIMPEPLIAKDIIESGKDLSPTNLLFGSGAISAYENPKEAQPELSSSMVSQSFGVPDMAFNSIDSTINDGSSMNRGAWATPQIPRMRTFTKVYKRGAVGRSIDITRYNGYDELKQDLARRFGIEGQLEDRQRIGWKLVYVDHENDVLLVGDDPWQEFVNCVRCIKILSPQEVQQINLDGEFGNSVVPNQACSSSDNGI